MPANPSLFHLVSNSHQQRVFTSTVDVLNILSTQIEQTILHNAIAPHIFIGMQSFSAFELFASHYTDLAEKSEKLTVFGVADKQPRQVPNTEFIALPQETTLARERFVVVNHPDWQVALLAQEDVDEERWGRQRRYNGLLTFSPTVVERCNMIVSMLSGYQPTSVGKADPVSHQQHIAQFVTRTATLPNLPDFDLSLVLGEVPRLWAFASQLKPQIGLHERLTWLLHQGRQILQVDQVTLYRHEGMNLRPIVSTDSLDTLSGVVMGQGALGRAAQTQRPTCVNGGDAAQALDNARYQALYMMPLFAPDRHELWGLLTFGSQNYEQFDSEQATLALAMFNGVAQALVGNDRTEAPQDAPIPEAPSQGSPAPQSAQAPPVPSSVPTRAASRGRIRLGPRRSGHDQPAATPSIPEGDLDLVRLPTVKAQPQNEDPMTDFQRRIIGHLLGFDRDGADRVWREAYTRFPARELCINLLQPVLIAVGEGWHRGQVSVAAEHFTTSYVESKIVAFLNSYPDNPQGQTIITGCGQGETHETGIMMLSLFFRWEGYRVIYLGANVPNSTLEDVLLEVRPDLLALSATMKENANNLTEVGHVINKLDHPRPIFGFGGAAFIFFPEMRERINGVYLGDDPDSILKNVRTLLTERRQRLGK